MAATSEAMRDALTGALYAALKARGLAASMDVVAGAVETAMQTTGYDAMADYVATAEALIPLYQAEVPTPPPGIEAALVEVESRRETIRDNLINTSLMVEP